MFASQLLARIRRTAISSLLGATVAALWGGSGHTQVQTHNSRPNDLAAARALLRALYPDLSGKSLIVSYSGNFSLDDDRDPYPNMLDIIVSPFPTNHHPNIAGVFGQDSSKPAAPSHTELGAFVWFGRGGYVYRFAAKSDKILNTSKNEAVRKLIDSHPEWPDTRI